MGVKERQEREREAVSRAILDAARELFVTHGYHEVSIRKIADRIEYSPAAIYGYFPSKDDIFFALAEEGFRLLCSSTSDHHSPTDAVDAIRQPFLHVYEFSKSHPEYFALMFLDRTVPKISKDWSRFGFVKDLRFEVDRIIQSAIDGGHFPAGISAELVFRVLLTAIQGAAVSRLCDRMAFGADADAIARDTLEAALTGLRAGFPVTSQPAPCEDSAHHQ